MITFSSFDLHMIEWAMLRSVQDHILLSQSEDLAANERERYLQLQIASHELDLLKRVAEADVLRSPYVVNQTVKLGKRIEDLMPLNAPEAPSRPALGLVQTERCTHEGTCTVCGSARHRHHEPGPVIDCTESDTPGEHGDPSDGWNPDGAGAFDHIPVKPHPDTHNIGDVVKKVKPHYRPPTDFYAPPF